MENNPIYGEHGVIRDRSQDYEKATEGKALEVPPHLRAPGTGSNLEIPHIDATASQRSDDYKVPRPEFFYTESTNDSVNLARDGSEKLIIVDAPIDQVWLKLQDFWAFNGIALEDTDPTKGVMETVWIDGDGKELSFVDHWIKRLTFQEIDGPPMDKLQVTLRPEGSDVTRTSIAMKHVRFSKDEDVTAVDWNAAAQEVGYKSEMMFEMLRYLSKASDKEDAPTLAKLQQPRIGKTAVGRDSRGNPVLKVEGSVDAVWNSVSKAMSTNRFDVGTRDQDAGMIYFSYTTSVPADETDKMGFFEWLHSDKGQITFKTTALAEALGVDGKDDAIRYSSLKASDEEVARKSQMTKEELEQEAMQKSEGFKIWLAGKVVYVFGTNEEEDEGVYNEEKDAYEYTGRYQLKLNRSRSGVYLTVLNEEGLAAQKDISEEILWDVKSGLSKN